jgi:hypothetical protein
MSFLIGLRVVIGFWNLSTDDEFVWGIHADRYHQCSTVPLLHRPRRVGPARVAPEAEGIFIERLNITVGGKRGYLFHRYRVQVSSRMRSLIAAATDISSLTVAGRVQVSCCAK